MIILKYILIFTHVIASILLVVVILMQASKGGGLSGTFGGQGSSSLFGPRSAANVLSTATQYLAGIFLVLSLVLSLMAGASSTVQSVTQKVLENSPAAQLPDVGGDLDFGTPGASSEGSEPINPDASEQPAPAAGSVESATPPVTPPSGESGGN
ncbi:MAG: preprotein translocase subunit SecG [Calditrichota bacterium]